MGTARDKKRKKKKKKKEESGHIGPEGEEPCGKKRETKQTVPAASEAKIPYAVKKKKRGGIASMTAGKKKLLAADLQTANGGP